MTQRTERQPRQVPSFADEHEAADFWDDHSPLDYPEEFQEADVEVDRPLVKRGVMVKLDLDTAEQLTTIARQRGIGPSTLARMWILERLRAADAHQAGG